MSIDTAAAPQLRDPTKLWGWTRGFLIFFILLLIAMSFARVGVIGTGTDYSGELSDPALIAAGLFGLLSIAYLVVFIVCVVLVGRTTFRMMKNLHQLQSPEVKISPGWAVGWYFIPFANLVMPQRAVGEIWRGTFDHRDAPPDDPKGAIGWWWGTWIVGNILSSIEDRLAERSGGYSDAGPHDVETYNAALSFGIAGSVVSIAAAIFLILLFGKIVRGQKALVQISAFSEPAG